MVCVSKNKFRKQKCLWRTTITLWWYCYGRVVFWDLIIFLLTCLFLPKKKWEGTFLKAIKCIFTSHAWKKNKKVEKMCIIPVEPMVSVKSKRHFWKIKGGRRREWKETANADLLHRHSFQALFWKIEIRGVFMSRTEKPRNENKRPNKQSTETHPNLSVTQRPWSESPSAVRNPVNKVSVILNQGHRWNAMTVLSSH